MRALMLSTVARPERSVTSPAAGSMRRWTRPTSRTSTPLRAGERAPCLLRRVIGSSFKPQQRGPRAREKFVLVLVGRRDRAAGRTSRGSASAPEAPRPSGGSGSGSRAAPGSARHPGLARERWYSPLLNEPISPSHAARSFGKHDERVVGRPSRRPCARSTPRAATAPLELRGRGRSARRGTRRRRDSAGSRSRPSSRARPPAAHAAAGRRQRRPDHDEIEVAGVVAEIDPLDCGVGSQRHSTVAPAINLTR